MAITKARMQVKRGNESDFDPSQMLPGEWAVSLDTKYVRMCFAPGICVRMATYDAFEADMEEIRDILLEAQTIQEAVARIQTEINDTAVVVEDYSVLSKSYAVGGTGKRENEDSDNAKYYYEQTKQISQGINGIVPMGTVAFADLPTSNIVNNAMYNVSDAFTSDARFNDGGGIYYGPGNNVIWTAEGKWDVTASSSVTGIKGSAESAYRVGNVNITPANIGLGNVNNTSDADKPISTATQAALDALNGSLEYHFKRLGYYIEPSEVSDLTTIDKGIYLFNGWATYTNHKPFDNAWGIWIKTADESLTSVYEIVINFDTGAVYKSNNYGDFSSLDNKLQYVEQSVDIGAMTDGQEVIVDYASHIPSGYICVSKELELNGSGFTYCIVTKSYNNQFVVRATYATAELTGKVKLFCMKQ